jgi:hypothetical protein
MIESRACPECGAEVPIGRLSCGACGALLASVQGRWAAEASTDDRPGLEDDAPDEAGTPALVAAPDANVSQATRPVESPAPSGSPATPSGPPPDLSQASALLPEEPRSADQPERAEDRVVPPSPPMPPIPGGYLPPSAVSRSAPVMIPGPSPEMPASTSVPPPPDAAAPVPPVRHVAARRDAVQPEQAALPGSADRAPSPGRSVRAPVLELPFSIAPGVGPVLVVTGASLGVVSFVLPWVEGGGAVIGGGIGSGYFSTWGLAAAGNVLPFLLAWLSLILAILPNRVPRLIALGLGPVFLGGILAGIGWTYLLASSGVAIGIWALAGGALLLAVGGSLVLHGDRAAG